MSQKLSHTYKAALNSNDFCQWLLGILEPGVYRGFDYMTISGLDFEINHLGTGIVQTDESIAATDPTGVILTKQGVTVQENAPITGLSCGTNVANPFIRIDTVYLDHADVNIVGGQAATYGVVQGPNGLSIPNALPAPLRQIKIGEIRIPASATDLSAAVFTRSLAPMLGGYDIVGLNFSDALNSAYAQLNTKNTFAGMQVWNKASTAAAITTGKLTLNGEGNTFEITAMNTVQEMDALGEGAIVFLYKTGAGNFNLTLNASPAHGGLKFYSLPLQDNGITAINLSTGEHVGLIQIGSIWHVFTDTRELGFLIQGLETSLVIDEARIAVLEADIADIDAAWTAATGFALSSHNDSGTALTPGGSVNIKYKKRGKTIHIQGTITGADVSTGNADTGWREITINGLPFTFSGNSNGVARAYSAGAAQSANKFIITTCGGAGTTLVIGPANLVYVPFKATDITVEFSITAPIS